MAIKLIIEPREKDLGGVTVRRVLPISAQRMVGPWIFFDEMGPVNFAAGQGIDVKPHPHINLATVTYLFEGELLHRDSLGTVQTIQPGAINLMVAGKGITHSERERDETRNSEHRLHGLQLWHALPEELEETEPAFYHVPAAAIPAATPGSVTVRVLMGCAYDVTSPVKTFGDTLYLEASMQAGQILTLPEKEQLAVYVVAGQLMLEEQTVDAHTMIVFDDYSTPTIQAQANTRLAIIGGERMSPRFIDWNFISSRQKTNRRSQRYVA